MNGNIILGFVTMAVCTAIQCVVVGVLLDVLFAMERRKLFRPDLIGTTCVLIAALLFMMTGNLGQVAVWALLFLLRGEFTDFATAFYHSLVNFTTLGYGDVVMSERARILGALEAANGVLMFGLTTSVMFVFLNSQMQREWTARKSTESVSTDSPDEGR